MVVGGAAADHLHGAAGVKQRHGEHVSVGGETVAEDEGAKAALGEPVATWRPSWMAARLT